jgi:hypothetical protein
MSNRELRRRKIRMTRRTALASPLRGLRRRRRRIRWCGQRRRCRSVVRSRSSSRRRSSAPGSNSVRRRLRPHRRRRARGLLRRLLLRKRRSRRRSSGAPVDFLEGGGSVSVSQQQGRCCRASLDRTAGGGCPHMSIQAETLPSGGFLGLLMVDVGDESPHFSQKTREMGSRPTAGLLHEHLPN